MYMLRGQWLDFVRDNHVQVEDICILVPAKGGRRFTFTVYLLHATATHSRGGTAFQRVGSFHGRSSTKMASAVHIKEASSDGIIEKHKNLYHYTSFLSYGLQFSAADHVSSDSDKDEASHKSLKSNSGGPSEAPYIVSSKSCLSQSQKKIVEEKVRAIQSEVPVFVAIMKKMNADVTYRYCIMVSYLSYFDLILFYNSY
jgi:hypothetical protein